MKAVILAGGKGKRLRPLTYKNPKPLLPVKGKPILEHVINYLKGYGITDLIVTTEYMGDRIREHFRDGKRFGVRITYSEEKKPLGTAGCLTLIKDKLNETFILIGGDNLTKMNLKKFIEFHKKKKGILTAALFEFEEKSKWGIYNLNEDKSILNFTEKPVFKHTAGTMIFCLEPEIFEHIPKNPKGVVNLTDHIIPDLLRKGVKIFGFEFKDLWEDIGGHDDYKRVNKMKDPIC
jgi:NDP-sugar pyrophosphorylase family protein